MATNTVIIGAQWGDEGKGKIIDVLAAEADVVVRYQGGGNAGHTVEVGAKRFVLHHIPCGILRPRKMCVIGNGVVVDPIALVQEIRDLESRGVWSEGRLWVSDRAHVVFPYHRALDESLEGSCGRERRIGTTKRGIGPSYGDKAMRCGLRVADLLEPDFAALYGERIAEKNRILKARGAEPFDAEDLIEKAKKAATFLRPFVADTVSMLNEAVAAGRTILFEGAQGTLLDIDFGTYPFVTSSNATVGGACTGTGLAPRHIGRVVGVVKAYTTRVGEGPFPTELVDETGQALGREGNEFGATTGRPRRCGWFDAVAARYSRMVNGLDWLAVTKLDVLDSFETVRICVAYQSGTERYETMPASSRILAECRPVYEDWPGWRASTRGVARYQDLPQRARDYVERLCELTGAPLGMLSVGPGRDNTLRIGV